METATLQSHNQSPDCAATIYGNGDTTVAQTVPPTVLQPFMETADVKVALDGANIEKTTRSRALSVYGNGIC
jgi:hypothetical protein